MTEPQRRLDDFAQHKSAETDSENSESREGETSNQNNDRNLVSSSLAGTTNSEASNDKAEQEDTSHYTDHDNSTDSELRFGKDPNEFDISCLWARRHLAHRSANTLKKKALSENSLPNYETILREYVNYIHDHDQSVLDVEFPRFEEYILFCVRIGRRTKTILSRVSMVRGLYEHIELNEEVDANISSIEFNQIEKDAIDDLTQSSIQREALSREELEKLFNSMKCERDRLMAITGAETGFRNSDIRHIRLDDIDFEEPEIYARDPKYSKPYTVPISDELALELEIWIDTKREANYGHHDSKFLFPSRKGDKLETNHRLSMIIREAAENANIQGELGSTDIESKYLKREKTSVTWNRVTPHVLRHSFITILENEGVSLEYRRLLANHSSAETTRQYSHGKKNLLKVAQRRVDLRY